MSRLLLLRHAKSDWGTAGLRDIDRPLSSRGVRAAGDMASEIAAAGMVPDRVLCSPARRTRETLAAIRPHLRNEDEVIFVDGLYETGPRDYLGAIVNLGGDADTLMVIGHNPSIQGVALSLAGSGEPALLADVAAKYPTGGLAIITFDADDWTRVSPRKGRLVAYIKPRDLEAPGSDGDHED